MTEPPDMVFDLSGGFFCGIALFRYCAPVKNNCWICFCLLTKVDFCFIMNIYI